MLSTACAVTHVDTTINAEAVTEAPSEQYKPGRRGQAGPKQIEKARAEWLRLAHAVEVNEQDRSKPEHGGEVRVLVSTGISESFFDRGTVESCAVRYLLCDGNLYIVKMTDGPHSDSHSRILSHVEFYVQSSGEGYLVCSDARTQYFGNSIRVPDISVRPAYPAGNEPLDIKGLPHSRAIIEIEWGHRTGSGTREVGQTYMGWVDSVRSFTGIRIFRRRVPDDNHDNRQFAACAVQWRKTEPNGNIEFHDAISFGSCDMDRAARSAFEEPMANVLPPVTHWRRVLFVEPDAPPCSCWSRVSPSSSVEDYAGSRD